MVKKIAQFKTLKSLSLVSVLIAVLALVAAGPVTAQPFTVLHSFSGNDGASPYAKMVLSGKSLYGTTKNGGAADAGTVFKVNTDGSGFTNVHIFTGNNDGANPQAGLVLSGNTLYGAAPYAGTNQLGTLFKVNLDGSGFTNLHTFSLTSGPNGTNSDGVGPFGGLILAGNRLYGTASSGGASGFGTVFSVNTNGTGFSTLYNFTFTNGDGAYPNGMVLSNNTLYGTTLYGGSGGSGSLFKLTTNGASYTNLHSFIAGDDGANPNADLILVNNALYGTAQFGGSANLGAVFKVNIDGSGFTNLHSFASSSDEAYSFAGLTLSGKTLYGTAYLGGSWNKGTIFKIDTEGIGFINIYDFDGDSGAYPYGALISSSNRLFGTTSAGGSSGKGTIFNLSLPLPQLTIIRSGSNVVLKWPTNTTGFTLEFATNLVSSTVWTPVFSEGVVDNGNNSVTNSATGPKKFYRLNPANP